MEKYEALELQVISFEVDDVLGQGQQAVAIAGSGQAFIVPGNNNPVIP